MSKPTNTKGQCPKVTNQLLKKQVNAGFNPVIPKSLERVDIHEARRIARLDSQGESNSPDEYVLRNTFSYYVLINTWLEQVEERSPRGSIDLLTQISYRGLIPLIKVCVLASDSIGNGNPTFPREILQIGLDWESDLNGLMQVLRYPKRFSPASADKCSDRSLHSLMVIENHLKMRQRRPYPWFILSRCKAIIADILDGYDTKADLTGFSNGVAHDASSPLLHKLKACAYADPAILGQSYLLALGDPVADTLFGKSDQRYYCNIASSVPKSYKATRIIAAERADYQFRANAMLMEMESCISKNGYEPYLSLHDQSHNQELARIGSIYGNFATIDLSHASDSVSRSLVRELFPAQVSEAMFRLLPSHINVGGTTKLMQMFCTAGSKLTFPVESITFLAICIASMEWLDLIEGICRPLELAVYGDDMVVPTYAAPAVIMFLEALDFSVNTEKSFTQGHEFYRESCGVEYWRGIDTSSRYYPRVIVELTDTGGNTPNCLSVLTSLQHKLYHCWTAQTFLKGVVRCINPKMTSHLPSTDCADLWEDSPLFQTVEAPHKKGTKCEYTRERHLVPKSIPDTNWKCQKPCCRRSPLIGDDMRLYSMYEYYSFLKYGPRYEDPLSRMLGISMPAPKLKDISFPAQISWTMSID